MARGPKSRGWRKREARRGRADVEERANPTPETVAKQRPDPLKALADLGRLDGAGLAAAYEIRDVYTAVCRDAMMTGMSYTRSSGGRRAEIPEELARAHARRYLPWVAETGSRIVDAVLRVVVEGEPPGGASEGEICRALRRYAGRMPLWAVRRAG
jgi:hypothetical protein